MTKKEQKANIQVLLITTTPYIYARHLQVTKNKRYSLFI